MADVKATHKDYAEFKARADLIDDVLESRVKAKGDVYLPRPNATDLSPENRARYTAYLFRTLFYNFTATTRAGLVGAAFIKPPEVDLGPALAYMGKDADGLGNSITQQARSVVSDVLARGRHALYADYPKTEGSISIAEMERKGIRASIVSVDARKVINWRTTVVGARHLLSLVVIRDDETRVTPDGFGEETVERYRVLRLSVLDNALTYTVTIYTATDKAGEFNEETHTPRKKNGAVWTEIPFTFCGAENNDVAVDAPPLYDLAQINLGHYRNSADYEDSVYMCGQVQPWASGISQSYYQMLKTEGIQVGSRQLFPVPEGGSFGFAQAGANTLVREAMQDKEAQAKAIGARLITPGSAPKTATEAQDDNETQHSVLSLVVSNVSAAYQRVLGWCSEYMGGSGTPVFEISQEFTNIQLDSQGVMALAALWNTGRYPDSDLWMKLRKAGYIDPEKTDEEILDELDTNPPGLTLGDE